MKGAVKKLHAGMIGRPQNDLRHTGHIGYDGAVFGDVSFIGDNYDKLPIKVVTPCKYSQGVLAYRGGIKSQTNCKISLHNIALF